MKLTDKARAAIQTAIATHASGRYVVDPATHHATRRVLKREGLVAEDGWSLTDKGQELRTYLIMRATATVTEPVAMVSWSYRNGDAVWGPYRSYPGFDAEKYARGMVELLARQGTHTELIRNTYKGGATVERTSVVIESHNAPVAETLAQALPTEVLTSEIKAQGPIGMQDMSSEAVQRRERSAKLRDAIRRTRAVLR